MPDADPLRFQGVGQIVGPIAVHARPLRKAQVRGIPAEPRGRAPVRLNGLRREDAEPASGSRLNCHRCGELEEPLPYFPETLKGKPRVLGEDHPITLNIVNRMGVVLDQLIQELIAKHGEVYPATIKARRYQATFFASSSRGEEALGESDPMTLESLEELIRLFAENNQWKEADPLSKRLLALTPEESPALVGRREFLQLVESSQED